VSGVGCFPRTEISKFHIARYQFAELKIELTIFKTNKQRLKAVTDITEKPMQICYFETIMQWKDPVYM